MTDSKYPCRLNDFALLFRYYSVIGSVLSLHNPM